jgi:hypothetical protein
MASALRLGHYAAGSQSLARSQAAVSASEVGWSNRAPSCPAPPSSSNRLRAPVLTSAWWRALGRENDVVPGRRARSGTAARQPTPGQQAQFPGPADPGRRCPRHPAARPRRRTAAGGPPPRCVTRARFGPSGRAASPGRLRQRHPDADPLGRQAQPRPVPAQPAHRRLQIVQLAGEPRAGNMTVVDRHLGDAAGGQRGESPRAVVGLVAATPSAPVDVDGDWRVVVRGW